MQYNFDEWIDRRKTWSSRWNYDWVRKAGNKIIGDEHTIPMSIADMDFVCAQPIQEALEQAIAQRTYGYISPAAVPEYYHALCNWYHSRYGWEIDPKTLIYNINTEVSLATGVKAFTQPGDKVLVSCPVFTSIMNTPKNLGREVVNSPLVNRDGYYTMDFADLEEKAKDPAVKMYIICNPQNPTGRIWTPEELRQLSDICVRNGVLLVSDEVHADLTRTGLNYTPALAVANPDNTVAYISLNKTFSIASLFCSNVVIPNPNLYARYLRENGKPAFPLFGMAAMLAAYTKGGEWLEQVRAYLDGTIDWALDFIAEKIPGIKAWRPEACYFLWLDCSSYGLTQQELHKKFWIDANLIVNDGIYFGQEQGAGFMRLNIAMPRFLVQEALGRIAAALSDS